MENLTENNFYDEKNSLEPTVTVTKTNEKVDKNTEKSIIKIKNSRNIMLFCNTVAAIFISSIYFVIPNFIFIICGIGIFLTNFLIFIIFKKFLNKTSKFQ